MMPMHVLRSRPDNIPQHEDVYNRNAQAWHYTNARINELIQEAEQALENRDRELAHGPQFGPPKDSNTPRNFPLVLCQPQVMTGRKNRD